MLAFLAIGMISAASNAQSIYPAKGQSPEQMDKDKGECHMWAVKDSGFDPASRVAPPPTITVQGEKVQQTGGRLRGAARGAAAGAVIGEVADNDPGKGAAAGAATGAVVAGSRLRRANAAPPPVSEQPNPEYNQYMQDRARYDGAVKACLTGRGYTLS
jgi:hypothetical protein